MAGRSFGPSAGAREDEEDLRRPVQPQDLESIESAKGSERLDLAAVARVQESQTPGARDRREVRYPTGLQVKLTKPG